MPFDVYDHAWANERDSATWTCERAIVSHRPIRPGIGSRKTVSGTWASNFWDASTEPTWMAGSGTRKRSPTTSWRRSLIRIYPVSGHVGPGFLTTYYPGKWERTGRATSPTFTARDDQYLVFLIAGEPHDRVGLRLLADGEEVALWRGVSWEAFELVVYPLRQLAGKELQLEIFNHEIGDRPRLMLDHVMLVRRES